MRLIITYHLQFPTGATSARLPISSGGHRDGRAASDLLAIASQRPSGRTAAPSCAGGRAARLVAAALSNVHMQAVAEDAGETGWRALLVPVSVDGAPG